MPRRIGAAIASVQAPHHPPDCSSLDPPTAARRALPRQLNDAGVAQASARGVTSQWRLTSLLRGSVSAAKVRQANPFRASVAHGSTQLLVYQLIPYSLSEYLSSGASGYHLFQFDNVLWRDRPSGEALRDLAKHYYSVPQAVDIGSLPMTLKPELAWGKTDCEVGEFIVIPDAGRESSGQHPTQCRIKAFPSSAVDADEQLLANCAKRLREGTRYRLY